MINVLLDYNWDILINIKNNTCVSLDQDWYIDLKLIMQINVRRVNEIWKVR